MKQLLIAATSLMLLTASCSKKKTETPQPAPVAAPTGAKVFEKDISTMPWTTVGNSSNGYLSLTVDAPQVLTQNALDSNVVLVYVYTSDFNSQWALLPYHTERNITVTADVTVGQLRLKKQQDGRPSTQSWHNRVRVVLQPIVGVGVLQKQG